MSYHRCLSELNTNEMELARQCFSGTFDFRYEVISSIREFPLSSPISFVFVSHQQVDISAICKQGDVADMLFAITFTLLSGE